MPYFEPALPDDLIKQLIRLQNTDEICPKMLSEAAPILVDSVKDAIKANIQHPDESTGDLVNSIKAFEPYKTKYEYWQVNASPSGRTKKKRTSGKVFARSKHGTMTSGRVLYNDDKLWWMEYGNSKQPARPVLEKAARNAETAVLNKLQEVYNREVEK